MLYMQKFRRAMRLMRAGGRRNGRALLPLLAAAAVFLALTLTVSAHLRPALREIALYTVNDAVTKTMNDSVAESIGAGSLDYNELVRLEKDESGNITALITNMARINSLQTRLTDDYMRHSSDVMKTDISVPLGSLLGGALLSGRGPGIPVRVLSVTNSTARFENSFSAAGINQTRHRIVLYMTVDIELLIPGERLKTQVETSVVIAETVIVGQVPEAYAQIG